MRSVTLRRLSVAETPQSFTRYFTVVEMNRSVTKDLVGFMALAGENHNVARMRFFDGFANGGGAVGFHDGSGIGAAQTDQRIVHDLQWIFRARIVACEDRDQIAQFSRGLSHKRPFRAVAVAATAEERDYPFGIKPARNGDRVAQRIFRVLIIDDYGKRLSFIDARLG